MPRRPPPDAIFPALGLLSALAVAGCSPAPEAAPARAQGVDRAAAPTRVATVTPERATIRRVTRQPGQIEAFETTAIHAKAAGYIENCAVDIGDPITKGQVLAELSVPELEAELRQKRAMVDQARSEVAQAQSGEEVAQAGVVSAGARVAEVQAAIRRTEADLARRQAEYDRTEQLVRESATTRSLLDEARSTLEASRAALDEARAQARSAEAALAEARAVQDKARADIAAAQARVEVAEADAARVGALFGYARIVAPYDGVVTRRNVDTGHLTIPGGEGEPLFVVARTDRVRIVVGVPEVDAPLVNPGDPAEVRLQALGGRTFAGTVARISYALDQATRTLRAEIDLENPDGVLRPGLYAYATIVDEEHADVPTLPVAAVLRDGDATYCMVVADGRAHRRAIEVGLGDGERVEVLSGLKDGEAVVSAHADALADGQPVEPAGPGESAAPPRKP